MDQHTTLAPDATDQSLAWYDGKFWKGCVAAFAVLRWVIVAVVFSLGIYLYQRDVNAQQTVSLVDVKREQDQMKTNIAEYKAETEKQFQVIRKEMLTRELYEAYHKPDADRMDRMEKMIEQLLERQSRP